MSGLRHESVATEESQDCGGVGHDEDEDASGLVAEATAAEQEQKTELFIRSRSRRHELIGRILARWWYCLPAWPPHDYDYAKELERRKLKQVSFDQWELADDVDSDGFAKVYEITHFPGVYRDAKGNALDLRPSEGKPCYKFLSTKFSDDELKDLLRIALEKQISELYSSPYMNTDEKYLKRLHAELDRLIRECN